MSEESTNDLPISEEVRGHLEEFILAMEEAGLGHTGVKVNYTGIGDGSHEVHVRFLDRDHKIFPVDCDETMWEKASAILDRVLDAAHLSGWENDAGGGGTLTLFGTGKLCLDHYHNNETTADSESEFDVTQAVTDPGERPSPSVTFSEYLEWSKASAAFEVYRRASAILPVLRENGWVATVMYRGAGDSADGCEIQLEEVGTDGGACGPVLRKQSAKLLETALDEFTDQIIALAGHEGYENDDGGGGTMVLYPSGNVSLSHYYWTTEEDQIAFEATFAVNRPCPHSPRYEEIEQRAPAQWAAIQ